MKRLAKRFEKEIYEGAGHAFMRLQDGQNGANLKAAQAAWPRMLRFLKQEFGEPVSMSGSMWLPVAGVSAEDSCPCGDEPFLSTDHHSRQSQAVNRLFPACFHGGKRLA